jgi:serine/threonine protein kinase
VKKDGKKLAVKEIKESRDITGDIKRFIRECTALKLVKGVDNILQIHSIEKKKIFTEVMDVSIDYFDSSIILKNFDDILFQLINGLHGLHNRNIIHFDIKPQNIMTSRDLKTIKYIDFGGCVFTNDIAFKDQNREDNKYSYDFTMGYDSPESILDYPIDSKYDIWSLGVTLIKLISNIDIFMDEDEIQRLNMIFNFYACDQEEFKSYPSIGFNKKFIKMLKLPKATKYIPTKIPLIIYDMLHIDPA